MSDEHRPPEELGRLLSSLADGTLADSDRERLPALLQSDPVARAKYYDHVMLAALLRREGLRGGALNHPDATREPPLPAAAGVESQRPQADFHRATRPARRTRFRPWFVLIAAAVLVALLLCVGEATGVTHFVPTIIRIVTGQGSLVIEVDDPSVSVIVEGEDLTITGAGLHELRLKPGRHRVLTTRDGKQLHEEAVTIERGGKQIVKVSQEVSSPTGRLTELEQADVLSAEADRLCTLSGPMMAADPWHAEIHLRKAIALCEQMTTDFPNVAKYQQQRAKSRRFLSMALNYQTHRFVYQNRNPGAGEANRAVAIAKEATELSPHDAGFWTSLGRAQYRARDWDAALVSLQKGPTAQDYNGCGTRFFLAMVHWRLGNKDEARSFFDQALQWMDRNKPDDSWLRHDRAEASELFEATAGGPSQPGLSQPGQSGPETSASPRVIVP